MRHYCSSVNGLRTGKVVRRRRGCYNRVVKVESRHAWGVSVAEGRDIQRRLALLVTADGGPARVDYVAGVDTSVDRIAGTARAVVVVLDYPGLEPVETSVAEGPVLFPYVPGLLSFREAPLTLAACEKLTVTPDLVLVDGQGLAHPRRFGLACHLGLLLDVPTIGCAKSRLTGTYTEPGEAAGSWSPLEDRGEIIGAAVRTRRGVKPVFVSVGHRVGLENAIRWVLDCGRGYRLPEPCRQAHRASTGALPAAAC